MTSDYYKKGERLIKLRDTESAITAFVAGLDRGDARCAYGIYYTVAMVGSVTMTLYEAETIFNDNYFEIKALAEDGDAEAMVILAESARYGFSDDDEPYMFRLTKAAELGCKKAMDIIAEIEAEDEERQALMEAEERGIIPTACALPCGLDNTEARELVRALDKECILYTDDADEDLLESIGMLPDKAYSGFDDCIRDSGDDE